MANYYYSGQGSLYMGNRDANGKPAGLVAVGNVPELTIDIETTKFEHKESESGSRLVDATVIQEKKGTFNFKLENLTLDNLAVGLWGTAASVSGSSVTDEEITMGAYPKRSPVAFPDISSVTVTAKDGDDAPDRADSTAYDVGDFYVPATPNGHFYKCTVAGTSAGSPPTFATDGTTFADGTATFKDMGLVIRSSTTDYSVDGKNGVIVSRNGGSIADGQVHKVDYTYAASSKMDAFTSAAAPERYLRFEGLNTYDNSRVLVDIFKAQFDPLTGYALLNEEFASVDMQGTILSDSLQLSGSKFFRQWNVSA